MEHNIYDVEIHINVKKIEDLLIKSDKKKSILCFGGGTAGLALMKKLLYKYNVECFLDNNEKIQGSSIMGKEIRSPEIIRSKERGTFLILILSKHYEVIGAQLQGYGLEEGKDYFNIYNEFRDYFYIMKFDIMAKRFLGFIERTPRNIYDNVKIVSNRRIGVICNGTMEKNALWFAIAQYLVLRRRGYKPVLIVDNLVSYDDYIYFPEYRSIIQIYIDYVIHFLNEYFSEMDVLYITPENKQELDSRDEEQIDICSKSVLKWLDSRYDEQFMNGKPGREKVSKEILNENLKCLKAFFQENSFETINVYSGIHKHRILYPYVGERLGIRVSTYDGDIGLLVLYETRGVASHSGDILRLLQEDWFAEKEKKEILDMAEKEFAIRRSSTVRDAGYNYQLVGSDNKIAKGYDIMIPLNISWDAAALNVDDVFEDYIEWLNKTLEYIVNNTNASVIVREHPAQNTLPNYKFEDITRKVPFLTEASERVWFCRAGEKINTYQYLEMSKLVLPYTSTVGVEAVIMRKPIITHTKAYYGKLKFGNKVSSEKEYYDMIQSALDGKLIVTEEERKEALLAYFFQMRHIAKIDFTDGCDKWLDYSIDEIIEWDGVDDIVDIIANNIPLIYKNVMKKLDEKVRKDAK